MGVVTSTKGLWGVHSPPSHLEAFTVWQDCCAAAVAGNGAFATCGGACSVTCILCAAGQAIHRVSKAEELGSIAQATSCQQA
jgi:hypothetical protein